MAVIAGPLAACHTADDEAPVVAKVSASRVQPRADAFNSATCPLGCQTPKPATPPKPCEETDGSSTIRCDGLSRVTTYCPLANAPLIENIPPNDPEYQEGSISLCWYDQAKHYCCYGGSGPKDPARYDVNWYGDGGPGAQNVDLCACPSNQTCNALGNCEAPSGDAGPPPPACSSTPTYPPRRSDDTGRLAFGFQVPDPTATWACTQLSAVPYVGQALFTPTGGLSISADVQVTATDEWQPTCKHRRTSSTGVGVQVNICSLRIDGRYDDRRTTLDQHCVDCNPTSATCGNIACTDETRTLTRQATISRSFPISLARSSSNDSCGGDPPRSDWLDWILENVSIDATLGGGWTGSSLDTTRTLQDPTCGQPCADCETHLERNNVFLQASAMASLSTPTIAGFSGSAFVSIAGRVGVGREDQTSTCVATCGGYNALAEITLRAGVSAGAFGYRFSRSVGYTCRWNTTWSDCPNASDTNTSGCGWATATDP